MTAILVVLHIHLSSAVYWRFSLLSRCWQASQQLESAVKIALCMDTSKHMDTNTKTQEHAYLEGHPNPHLPDFRSAKHMGVALCAGPREAPPRPVPLPAWPYSRIAGHGLGGVKLTRPGHGRKAYVGMLWAIGQLTRSEPFAINSAR